MLKRNRNRLFAILAGEFLDDAAAVGAYGAKRDAEQAGVTALGFNLGVRRLVTKGFVAIEALWNERDDEPYEGLRLTAAGWAWIEQNESKFIVQKATSYKEIPF